MADAAPAPSAPTTTETPNTAQPATGAAGPAPARPAARAQPQAKPTASQTEASRVNGGAVPPSGQQAEGQRAAEEAVRAEARKLKLRIGGKEIEATADEIIAELGEDGVVDAAQIARAARLKMRRVTEREKELDAAVGDLRDEARAMAVLERFHKPERLRAMMEDRYARFLDDDRVSPEEREKTQLASEIEQLRAKRDELQQGEQKRQHAARVAQGQRRIGKALSAAAAGAGLDGKDPGTIADLAALIEGSLDDGEPYTPQEAARVLSERHQKRFAAQLAALAPEKLAELLGPEGVKRWRLWDVARLRAARGAASPGARAATAAKPTRDPLTGQYQGEQPKRIGMREYFDELAKKGGR